MVVQQIVQQPTVFRVASGFVLKGDANAARIIATFTCTEFVAAKKRAIQENAKLYFTEREPGKGLVWLRYTDTAGRQVTDTLDNIYVVKPLPGYENDPEFKLPPRPEKNEFSPLGPR